MWACFQDNGDVLRRALDFEVVGRRGHGQSNAVPKKQVEEHTDEIGLKKENAINTVKWHEGVYKPLRNMR